MAPLHIQVGSDKSILWVVAFRQACAVLYIIMIIWMLLHSILALLVHVLNPSDLLNSTLYSNPVTSWK